MRAVRPSTAAELAEWLSSSRERFREEGLPVVTGRASDSRVDLDPAPRRGVALDRMAEVLDFRPRDLTITVGAGMRMSDLAGVVDEAGLWLPGANGQADRSVGGWVAAAPAGPYDHSFGPVRRHVLACTVVQWDGTVTRWGRPVMKNVAGYDVVKLLCGSRGRLGFIADVSLRLWPRPLARRSFDLAGESLSSPGLLVQEAPRFERVAWRASPRSLEAATATVSLLGGPDSVGRRGEMLDRWAGENGLDFQETEPASRGDSGKAPRPATSAAYRVTFGRRYLVGGLKDLARRVERETDAWTLESLPASGVVRLLTDGQAAAGRRQAPAWLATLGDAAGRARGPLPSLEGAAVRIERGGEAEHTVARRLRSAGVRDIERRWLDVFGGVEVPWQADYL